MEAHPISTFECPVVPIALEPHPNADALSIVPVYGYACVVRTEDWQGKVSGVYVPVDSLVDTARPEFAFLADRAKADGTARIKAVKLRGVFSQGLLVPIPGTDVVAIGDDMREALGVAKYEPPPEPVGQALNAWEAEAPPISVGFTDIEAIRRYADVFEPGEPVVVTEKVHGANARYTFQDGTFHVGSHKRWIKQGNSAWWVAAMDNPWIEKFCRQFPDTILFGEVYGRVQDLRYGLTGFAFRAFDVYDPHLGQYNPALLGVADTTVDVVPVLYMGPFDFPLIAKLAEQDSQLCPGQLMEGVVVRPERERYDHRVGRVVLKLHSQRYLLRREG